MSTSLPSDPEDEDLAFINGMCPQIFIPMEMMDLEEEEADEYAGDPDDEEKECLALKELLLFQEIIV